jgi:single-strand DNA-binding protein
MAKSLNKVQLIGRLGADPELKYTTTGTAVVSFSLATNRQWPGKDGTLNEETDWHNIVAWDRLAQICSEHLSKGRLVFIEGSLRHRSWEYNGQKQYRTEVIAADMLILDSRTAATEEQPPLPEQAPARTASRANTQRTTTGASTQGQGRRTAVVDDTDPDELPF